MALVAVVIAQCCLHHTDVQIETKLDTEVNCLKQELLSRAAELLSLQSMNAAQNQKLGLVEAQLAAAIETLNGLRNGMERRHTTKPKGACCACKPKTNVDAGTDPIIHPPAETSPQAATPLSPTSLVAPVINKEVSSPPAATSSTTPSPSVKLTAQGTNKPTRVSRSPAASTVTPSPLSKLAASSRATPSSRAPSVTLAAEALIDLINQPLVARGPSTPSPLPSVKLAKLGSAKSCPASRIPASPTSKPSRVTSPAAKTNPTMPIKATEAAEATDLISLASAANVASPLATLPLPSNPAATTMPRPEPVDVAQAVEGLISLNSAAHAPSPVTLLPASSPDATICRSSTWCMDIACAVPLPMPDKDEEDFFAAHQESPLPVTRMKLKAAVDGPVVPVQAVQEEVRTPSAISTSTTLQQSKLDRPKLEPKRRTVKQTKETLVRVQQKVQPAQPKRELTESKAAQVATLLNYMSYTRKALNRSSNPAKTFREVDEGLARMRLSIRKLEADYEALKLTGFTHKIDIPELLPRVKTDLDESVLER
ncbi:hypothetical protein HDU80_011523 [Chytriomyces hyalinus]|nr:hypothetical protein HDU80_011523 [Chytriomyces hyalinus]